MSLESLQHTSLFSFTILTSTANFENTEIRSQFVSISAALTDPQTVYQNCQYTHLCAHNTVLRNWDHKVVPISWGCDTLHIVRIISHLWFLEKEPVSIQITTIKLPDGGPDQAVHT